MGSFKFEVCKTPRARSVTASAQAAPLLIEDSCKLAPGSLLHSCPLQTKTHTGQAHMASAGSKRGRSAWEDCEDVSELKQHLAKQQDQIEKLRKEKAELSKAVKAAEGQASEESPEELNAQASRVLKSLIKHKCPDGVPQQVQQVQGCSGRTQPDTGTGVISLNKANQASIHQLRLQQQLLFL